MGSPSILVTRDGGAVPFTYEAGPGELWEIVAASALFDGGGASGEFLPCLSVYSQDGRLISRTFPPGESVAAGDDAEVSYLPLGLGGSSAAAAAGLSFAHMHTPGSGVTIASSLTNTYVSIQDTGGTSQFETNDAAVFTNGSSTLFTGAAVYGIQINAPGTYRVINNSFVLSGGTAGRQVVAYWAASNGSAASLFQSGRTGQLNAEAWDNQQAGVGPHLFTEEWMSVSAAQVGAVLVRYGRVNSGGAITMSLQMIVEQVSSYVATKL